LPVDPDWFRDNCDKTRSNRPYTVPPVACGYF